MSPRVAAALAGPLDRLARRLCGRGCCWWAEAEDLRQIGWRAALEADPSWDRRVGVPRLSYLMVAARRAMWGALWRQSAPVSAGDHHLEDLAGLHRAPLDPGLPGPRWDPEAELDDRRRWARVRAELLRLRDALPDLEHGWPVLLDGESPTAVAARTGVAVGRVYRAASRLREECRGSWVLWRAWLDEDDARPSRA